MNNLLEMDQMVPKCYFRKPLITWQLTFQCCQLLVLELLLTTKPRPLRGNSNYDVRFGSEITEASPKACDVINMSLEFPVLQTAS